MILWYAVTMMFRETIITFAQSDVAGGDSLLLIITLSKVNKYSVYGNKRMENDKGV